MIIEISHKRHINYALTPKKYPKMYFFFCVSLFGGFYIDHKIVLGWNMGLRILFRTISLRSFPHKFTLKRSFVFDIYTEVRFIMALHKKSYLVQ